MPTHHTLLSFISSVWSELWLSHPTLCDAGASLQWEQFGLDILGRCLTNPEDEQSLIAQANSGIESHLKEPWSGIYASTGAPGPNVDFPGNFTARISLLRGAPADPVRAAVELRNQLVAYGASEPVLLDFRHATLPNYGDGLAALLCLIPTRPTAVQSMTRLQRGFKGNSPLYYSDDIVTRDVPTPFALTSEGALSVPPFYLDMGAVSQFLAAAPKAQITLVCSVLSAAAFRKELFCIAESGIASVVIDRSLEVPSVGISTLADYKHWRFISSPCVLRSNNVSEDLIKSAIPEIAQPPALTSDARAPWLLALCKLRAAIQTFGLPYRSYLPQIEAAFLDAEQQIFSNGALDAERHFSKAIVALRDTHVFRTAVVAAGASTKRGYLPLRLTDCGGRCVVSAVHPSFTVVEPGDELLTIQGESPRTLVDRLRASWPHSNDHSALLRSYEEQGILNQLNWRETYQLTLLRNGRSVSCTVPVSSEGIPLAPRETGPNWLRDGIQYLDLTRPLSHPASDCDWTAIQNLIVDLRGYVTSNNPFDLIPTIISEPQPFAELEYICRIPGIYYSAIEERVPAFPYREVTGRYYPDPRGEEIKRVLILQDAFPISWLETFLLLVKQDRLVTLIGTPTSGANGNVSDITLPDSSSLYFGCMRLRNSLGEDAQGIGVIPHHHVAPTPEDLRVGRDTVLRYAMGMFGKEL